MADVVFSNVQKRYGVVNVIPGLDLTIPDGSFTVLVGPSGCGKSTLLRMIAGLEEVSGGTIEIGGDDVTTRDPSQRGIAMVFQSYALYPHMSVADNMSYSLRLRRSPKETIAAAVAGASAKLGLDPYLARRPKALSGGQRQRVAMGRAIVRNPKVFLFDEPLSNLDAKLRVQMRTEIKRVHQKVKTTTVYVTHDQVEAMTLADRVVVMNNGIIEQIGPPQELYHKPRTRFVAGFIGSPAMNFLPCTVESNGDALRVRLSDKIALPVPASRAAQYRSAVGKEMTFGLRPEHVTEPKSGNGASGGDSDFAAVLDVVEPMGMETMVYFTINGTEVCARVDPNAAGEAGATMRLHANMDHMHLIDPATGLVL